MKKRKVIVDLWGFCKKITVTEEDDKYQISGKLDEYHERCFSVPQLELKRRDTVLPGQHEWEDLYAIFWSVNGNIYFLKRIIHAPGWQIPSKECNDTYGLGY